MQEDAQEKKTSVREERCVGGEWLTWHDMIFPPSFFSNVYHHSQSAVIQKVERKTFL